MSPPSHVVFVTRKFPPAVGGMETLAEQTYSALERGVDRVDLLALGRSQVHLLWWLPLTLVRLVVLVARQVPDVVLVGDALTHAVLSPVLRRARSRTAVMVHGLDLTFDLPGYRPLVRRCLRRADRILANSQSTARIAIELGVAPGRTTVVNPAVESPRPDVAARRRAATRLRTEMGLPAGAHALVTVGRLVRRKGVGWFVEQVMPGIPDNTHYLVAGIGPDMERITEGAARAGLQDRVHLLGRVSDEVRELLFQGGDVFVQPNIPVDGDVEGFGLVTIEAAMRGMPVVASRLEGIEDAIVDGETGWLCEPGDAETFRSIVTDLLDDPAAGAAVERFQAESHRRFSSEGFPDRLTAALAPGPV